MSEYLGPLLREPDTIRSSLIKRKKKYIEKTVSSSNKDNLEDKISLEEKDDWRRLSLKLKKNKRSFSCRLAKDKPIDEQLEDEIWTIVAKMGFHELSHGRNFTVSVGPDVKPRQIDVFAKDDESALFIECTGCEEPKKKKMGSLIEKIESIRPKVYQSIKSHYTNDKLKLKWIIATRNIEWGAADLDKAKAANIIVLTDKEINYYKKLVDIYKNAAKYQFLSHVFAGGSIKGLNLTVPATRGKMGGYTFYNFLIKPMDLLKIAYVSHKGSSDLDDLDTYQRMLVPRRLKEIAKYVDSGGQFPTNIVINIKGEMRFDKSQTIGDSAFGTLYLPDKYGTAWVIDGQHRLYGYSYSKRASNPHDKTTLPVLAYENLPSTKEADLFVDINCEQVRVSKSLLNEIYATLRWDSDIFSERLDSLRSRIIMALNNHATSPFKDRIITTNRDKTHFRCLTLTSFSDGLKENKFFGEERGEGIKPGLLTDSKSKDLEATMRKATDILSYYFTLFSEAMPAHWELGDGKSNDTSKTDGYLCTNNGIRALLMVLKEILIHIKNMHYIETDLYDPADLNPYIKKYIKPVIDCFAEAKQEDIKIFRSRQALKGVRQNSLEILSLINGEFNDFLPAGLKEYLATIDVKGTAEAQRLIDKIQEMLFQKTIETLKNQFTNSEDEWWYEGLPETVRTSCVERCEKEKGIKDKIQYLYLIDYKTIAIANWDLLKDIYSFSKEGGREKQLKWLVDLNKIRNTTHHREKWPSTKDEVSFVRDIYNKVKNKFE